VWLHI
jgi:hypothetical protein